MNDDPSTRRKAGYGNPPHPTRFRPGQSGNPRGRPKGRHREAPYEAVLGRTVTVRDAGVERRVTAAEAFLLHLSKRGLEGDNAAARAAIRAIDEIRQHRIFDEDDVMTIITWQYVKSGSVNPALQLLRMAKVFDRYRDTAYLKLQPWIVEAALLRLGDCRLTPDQQRTVVKATRTPHKVRWPDWWTEMP